MKNKFLQKALAWQPHTQMLASVLAVVALHTATPAWAKAPLPPAAVAQAQVQAASQQPLPIPSHLFTLSHPIGQQRLLDSSYRQAYFPLATYFETQRNQAYCSVATSVIVLNAMELPRPASALYPDFPFFTQDNFFDGIDARIAQPEVVAKEGMTLDQLSTVLSHHAVTVQKIPGDTLELPAFRELLKTHLRESNRFVLLNFNRRLIGQKGGGHWSPLAAYHAASDSALLMDVARYKYPPVWVPLADLLAAAQDPDSVSNQPRGVVVVSPR